MKKINRFVYIFPNFCIGSILFLYLHIDIVLSLALTICIFIDTTVCACLGVKPLIHQSELKTYMYMKVVPFQEKSSFHFVVL